MDGELQVIGGFSPWGDGCERGIRAEMNSSGKRLRSLKYIAVLRRLRYDA